MSRITFSPLKEINASFTSSTCEVNQAMRNNPDKFPDGYVLTLDRKEYINLRSKFLTTKISPKTRQIPKAFTEKGLYISNHPQKSGRLPTLLTWILLKNLLPRAISSQKLLFLQFKVFISMITANDVYELLKQGEGLHVEMKACSDSLPRSIWESYSAFANTRGGVIILGVSEDKNKSLNNDRFQITGVSDVNKVITDFFNILNNKQKVNKSILVDSDVRTVEIEGKYIIHITVHEADYRQKPIYINDNLQSGTFKRVHEGDRHVTPQELTMLIRDSVDDTDQQIIEHYGMDDIDVETLTKYRKSFKALNTDNVFNDLSDKEFLTRLGGYSFDRNKDIEGLTMAGLLMFG